MPNETNGRADKPLASPYAWGFRLVWRPTDSLAMRGMFAQSLGGVSFDESYRLEPAQLAGFSQAFRTVIPESVVGSVSGHRLDIGGVAFDVKLPSRTYLGAQATFTRSAVDRTVGLFQLDPFGVVFFDPKVRQVPPGQPAQTAEFLRYEEKALQLTANKLIGLNWSFGAKYEFRRSQLDRRMPLITYATAEHTDLHALGLQAVFNASNGWFGRAASLWWWQTDQEETAVQLEQTKAQYWERHAQLDAEAGWRFPRQHGEFSFGVMNLLDNDYRLAPLSAVPELPRERVFFARLRLNF